MEWLNFRHLYSFWMVSKCSGFKNAAEEMNIAQSAISEQVALLEDYLGAKLINRSTRSLKLTQEGRELLAYAEVIFEQSREINAALRDKQSPGFAKNLRVGIVGGVSRNFLFRILASYSDQASDSRVNVISGSYDELNALLKTYELDIIVTLEPPLKRDLDELTYQKLGQSTLCLAGKRSLITAIRKRKLTKNQLFSLFTFSFRYEVDLLRDVIAPQVGMIFSERLTTDDIPLLRFFANSKNGVVVIPKIGILEDIEAGTLDHIPLERSPEINIYGIFTKKQTHRSSIDRLLSFKWK